MITIVDYGMGNLRSLAGAFEYLGVACRFADDAATVRAAERLVLPGVGSFAAAMHELRARGLDEAIVSAVRERGAPLLGVCLGMQLLATSGDEDGPTAGLGLVPGRVVRLTARSPSSTAALKVPHIGFHDVAVEPRSRFMAALPAAADFYFIHSYALAPDDEAVVSSWCEYGGRFAASVEQGNVLGTQFHPEKSQNAGLRLLMRFATGRWPPC